MIMCLPFHEDFLDSRRAQLIACRVQVGLVLACQLTDPVMGNHCVALQLVCPRFFKHPLGQTSCGTHDQFHQNARQASL